MWVEIGKYIINTDRVWWIEDEKRSEHDGPVLKLIFHAPDATGTNATQLWFDGPEYERAREALRGATVERRRRLGE